MAAITATRIHNKYVLPNHPKQKQIQTCESETACQWNLWNADMWSTGKQICVKLAPARSQREEAAHRVGANEELEVGRECLEEASCVYVQVVHNRVEDKVLNAVTAERVPRCLQHLQLHLQLRHPSCTTPSLHKNKLL